MNRNSLNERLLAAHDTRDAAILMQAYAEAASQFEADGDIDAAAFFTTHAMVFGLEAGHTDAKQFEQWLKRHGRM